MMVLVGMLAVAGLASAEGGGFDEELFESFLKARVGTGEPVYWYSIGEVYSYPDGALLARMEGFDTARLVRDETDPHTAYQLSRKTFVYRDPATNEIFREVDGEVCEPYEQLTVDVEEQHQGAIMEALGTRKGDLRNMQPDGQGRVRLDYIIPSRGLIGFRTQYLTTTAGTGLLYSVFDEYAPRVRGEIAQLDRDTKLLESRYRAGLAGGDEVVR